MNSSSGDSKWGFCPLSQFISRVIDYRGKTPPGATVGIPVISAAHVKRGKVIHCGKKFVTQATYDRWTTRGFIQPGDVLVTTEAPVGEIAQVPGDRTYLITRRVIALQLDQARAAPNFFKYALLSDDVRKGFERMSHGTTVPRLYKEDILDFKIAVPPLPTQRKIASILSAYDDLIENNTRRIAILEEMAQAIYREWFVNFRFPGHENVKLVDSPLGQIPEGWEPTNLGAISENFDRLRKPLSKMQRADMQGPYPYYGASKIFDYIDDYIFDGKYLLIGEDGSVITPDRKPVLQLAYDKFWVNNHTHVLRAIAPVSTDFLFLALSDTDVSPYVTGAAQPKINQRNLKSIPMRVGKAALMQQFDELVNPCIEGMRALHRKNENLRTTRDLLLPKLISGKLDVEDLDIDLGMTAEALEEATA